MEQLKKIYNFNIKGVVTQQEMENFIMEINNCEFCNHGTFDLSFTEFFFNEDEEMGMAIVEVFYERGINIHDALGEMINCEFCHDEVEHISIIPL